MIRFEMMPRTATFFLKYTPWACVLLLSLSVSGQDPSVKADAIKPDPETVERVRAAVAAGVGAELEAKQSPEMAELYRRLSARNKVLLERRRELEYEDPIASGLKKKLIAAEKEVLARRRSLQIRLDAIEEIQVIEAERRELMNEIQKLKQKERADGKKTVEE